MGCGKSKDVSKKIYGTLWDCSTIKYLLLAILPSTDLLFLLLARWKSSESCLKFLLRRKIAMKNLLMKKFYDSTVESLRLTPTSIDIAQVSCHICGALRDLVPFVQFKKCEKYPWRSVNFSTFLHGCFSCFSNCTNGIKSRNAPHLSALCPAISTLENSNPGNDRFILYNCYAVLVKF